MSVDVPSDSNCLIIHCGPWVERVGQLPVYSSSCTQTHSQKTTTQRAIARALTKGDFVSIISKDTLRDYWVAVSDQTSSDDGAINFWGTMVSKYNNDGLVGNTVQFQTKHIQSILWFEEKTRHCERTPAPITCKLNGSEKSDHHNHHVAESKRNETAPRYGYHKSRSEISTSPLGEKKSTEAIKPVVFEVDTNPRTGRLPKRKKK